MFFANSCILKSSDFMDITAYSSFKVKTAFQNNYHLLHPGFLLGLFFDPESGGDMSFRNVGWFLTDYVMLYPRK
jgi:hypothetical protein